MTTPPAALPGTPPLLWRDRAAIPADESRSKRHAAITRALPPAILERARQLSQGVAEQRGPARERMNRLLVDWTESLVHEQLRAERIIVAALTPSHPHPLDEVAVVPWTALEVIAAGWAPLDFVCTTCRQSVGEFFLVERDPAAGAWFRVTYAGRHEPVKLLWLGVHRVTLASWQSIEERYPELAVRYPIEYVHHVPTPVHVHANQWAAQSTAIPLEP